VRYDRIRTGQASGRRRRGDLVVRLGLAPHDRLGDAEGVLDGAHVVDAETEADALKLACEQGEGEVRRRRLWEDVEGYTVRVEEVLDRRAVSQ